jgi:hypothetical protein
MSLCSFSFFSTESLLPALGCPSSVTQEHYVPRFLFFFGTRDPHTPRHRDP